MAGMRHCTHCGISTDPDWHFCRTCGTPVDIEHAAHRSTFCTECSHPLAPSWRFCSRCGTPTPTSVAEQTSEVPGLERLERSDVAALERTEGTGQAGLILKPEIVEEPEIELISRQSDAAAPPDAPDPPPPTVPPTPIPIEEPPEREIAVASSAVLTSALDDTPTGPRLPSSLDRGDEPPISIYSRERLDAEPLDLTDFYPPARDEPSVAETADDPGGPSEQTDGDDRDSPAERAVPIPAPHDIEAVDAAGEADEERLQPELFRDLVTVASVTRVGFIAVAGLAGWFVMGLYLLNNRIVDVAAGRGSLSGMAAAETLVNGRIRPALAAAAAVTGMGLMLWSYRSYANIQAFGKTDLRASPWAAALSWLIPGVNLVLPVLLLNDAWRASDVYARSDPSWKRRPGNRWLTVFVIGIGAAIAASVASDLSGRLSFEAAVNANRWLMVGAAGVVVGCIGLARAIATITQRQQTRLPRTSPKVEPLAS